MKKLKLTLILATILTFSIIEKSFATPPKNPKIETENKNLQKEQPNFIPPKEYIKKEYVEDPVFKRKLYFFQNFPEYQDNELFIIPNNFKLFNFYMLLIKFTKFVKEFYENIPFNLNQELLHNFAIHVYKSFSTDLEETYNNEYVKDLDKIKSAINIYFQQ